MLHNNELSINDERRVEDIARCLAAKPGYKTQPEQEIEFLLEKVQELQRYLTDENESHVEIAYDLAEANTENERLLERVKELEKRSKNRL